MFENLSVSKYIDLHDTYNKVVSVITQNSNLAVISLSLLVIVWWPFSDEHGPIDHRTCQTAQVREIFLKY